MKNSYLVGLNDRIFVNDININNVKDCLKKLNPAVDIPVDINNILIDTKTATSEQIKNCINIWGNLLNVKPDESEGNISKDEAPEAYERVNTNSKEKYKIDLISPFYSQLRAGGLFTDKYGNKIAIIAKDNEIANTLLQKGYYGKESEYEIINYDENDYIDDTRYTGGGWKARFINFLIFWENGSKLIMQRLEAAGINQKRINKTIVVKVGRDAGIALSDITDTIITVALIVINLIPGIGQTITLAITAGMQYLKKYLENPNYTPTTKEIIEMGQAAVPVVSNGDSSIVNNLNSGATIYQAIQSNDYTTISTELGLSKTVSKVMLNNSQLQTAITENDIKKITDLAASNGIKADFNKINYTTQNTRNLTMNQNMVEITNNYEANLLREIDKQGLSGSPEFRKFMVMSTSGAFTGALPSMSGDKDGIQNLMQTDNTWKKNNEIHKVYLNMALSLPTGTAAFDELLLLSIENQLKNSNTKEITLPAQIPAEKSQCIANELSKSGYRVITSLYQANISNRNVIRKEWKQPDIKLITKSSSQFIYKAIK